MNGNAARDPFPRDSLARTAMRWFGHWRERITRDGVGPADTPGRSSNASPSTSAQSAQLFLSSVTDGLSTCRDRVQARLGPIVTVYRWESAPNGDTGILRRLRSALDRALLVVLLIGPRYGSTVSIAGVEKSHTEWEYDKALESRRKVLAFATSRTGDGYVEPQRRFLERVKSTLPAHEAQRIGIALEPGEYEDIPEFSAETDASADACAELVCARVTSFALHEAARRMAADVQRLQLLDRAMRVLYRQAVAAQLIIAAVFIFLLWLGHLTTTESLAIAAIAEVVYFLAGSGLRFFPSQRE